MIASILIFKQLSVSQPLGDTVVQSRSILAERGSNAQDTSWMLTIKNGGTIENISLDSLRENTLFYSAKEFTDSIKLSNIKQLRLIKESKYWKNALYGSVILGITCGGYMQFSNSGGMFKSIEVIISAVGGIIIGGLLGGISGLIAGKDIIIDDGYNLKNAIIANIKNNSNQIK